MTHVQTAIVVGGGIAGPVTAMALQRAGIEATVHEAYAKAADGVGGMLGLAPNGLDALAAIDLDGPIRHVAEPVSAMVVQSWTGKRLAQFDDPSGKPIMHVVWRPDLYRALYDEARRRGITIEHSHRFMDARESGDGVTARFSDDSTARADILIGADGSRSTIRSMIDPTAPPPRYTGLLGLGGLTTRAGVDSTNANYRMIFGKKAFFGYEVSDEGQISWFANLPHHDPLTLAQSREVSGRVAAHPSRRLRCRPDTGGSDHCRDLSGRPHDHRGARDHADGTNVESWPQRNRRGRSPRSVTKLWSGGINGNRECH